MGWLSDAGGHEGYVTVLGPDGRSADAYNSQLLFRRPDADARVKEAWARNEHPTDEAIYEAVPWSHFTGWRIECECGWRGTSWSRDETRPIDSDQPDHLYPGEVELIDGGRPLEDVGHEEWELHVRPLERLEVVKVAADAAAAAREALDAAVLTAREGSTPASWEQIGQAVGITRQSAHDRWAAR